MSEDKHKDLRRSLNENYIVIDEHKNKLEKVNDQLSTANDTITDLKTQLEDANKVAVKALQDKKRWSTLLTIFFINLRLSLVCRRVLLTSQGEHDEPLQPRQPYQRVPQRAQGMNV